MKILSSRKVSKLRLTNTFRELFTFFLRACLLLKAREPNRPSSITTLETKFVEALGEGQAILFPHARVALHYILKAFALEEGSEVLMTPLTIADIVNSVHLAGLKPRFVDIELRTLNHDLKLLRKAITPRSKVILVTYIAGIVPDFVGIIAIAKEHGLKVIEDGSQAFGSSLHGRKAGTWGDASVFSFTNFKVVSSLFGGMVFTRDRALAERLRQYVGTDLLPPIRTHLLRHASKNMLYLLLFNRWIFSYFTYALLVTLEYLAPGLTYRLYSGNIKVVLGGRQNFLYEQFPRRYLAHYTTQQADLALASLGRSATVVERRSSNGELLRRELQAVREVIVPGRLDGAVNAYWRFPLLTPQVEGLKKFLILNGIDSAKSFLCLCSREPGFELYHARKPVAEWFKETALLLEVDETLSEQTIRHVAETVKRFFSEAKSSGISSRGFFRSCAEWGVALLRPENRGIILGTLRRRWRGEDHLEIRVSLPVEGLSFPAFGGGVTLTPYSLRYRDRCVSLLNAVGSFGLWRPGRFEREVMARVEDPARDLLMLLDSQVVCGLLVMHPPAFSPYGYHEMGYLAVSPRYRGRRFGEKLVQALLCRAGELGWNEVRGFTDPFRPVAMAAFFRLGFRPRIRSGRDRERWDEIRPLLPTETIIEK